jgi:hypothetical protein
MYTRLRPEPRPLFRSGDKTLLIPYVQGYIVAMEDILKDNERIAKGEPGYRRPWQLIREVERSLASARRTLEILIHDVEVGGYPDEP